MLSSKHNVMMTAVFYRDNTLQNVQQTVITGQEVLDIIERNQPASTQTLMQKNNVFLFHQKALPSPLVKF
jgi:hypothetical protein